ncbi:MAG TPA: hypothetical protein PL193_02245 [Xanthobacteraceae bacterium]|nr:hypothetical protein [Xanthobacteraceae bacterium]
MQTTLSAVIITAATLSLGYCAFGGMTMMIFTAGFAGGLALWLALPTRGVWFDVRGPYWIALALFALHRVEENRSGFFARLAEVSGVPTPSLASPALVLLVVISVGAWLAIPALLKRGHALGQYFAWTFFASMGFTELAHILVFPFFTDTPLAYFPGMASVFALAPVAWWGMWRLYRGANT